MLEEKEIKDIISKNPVDVVPILKLLLIERHIFDVKGKEIKINHPIDFMKEHLMNMAYDVSYKYYKDKFKE